LFVFKINKAFTAKDISLGILPAHCKELFFRTSNRIKYEMNFPTHKFLACFFFGIFCYQISKSIQKYIKRSTILQSTLDEKEEIQYPSISVCTKYMFKHGSISKQLNSNKSLNEKKMLVLNSVWNKSEVFHFVNHPGMLGLKYPCVTSNDGTDPGKPCSFPFR
jgi:hypothetical protein